MRDTLFRPQVFEQKAGSAYGDVLISPPISVKILISTLSAMFLIALFFLFFGQYSRRETAKGILVPDRGMIKIFASPGIIGEVKVKEGQTVTENAELFSLSQDKILASDRAATITQLQELESLANNLQERLSLLPERKLKETQAIAKEIATIKKSIDISSVQMNLDLTRLKIKEDRQARIKPLFNAKAVSADEYQQDVDQLLQMKSKMQEGQQSLLQIVTRENSLKTKLDTIGGSYSDQEGALLGSLAQVKQQIATLSLQQHQSIASPIKGRVSSIQAYPGMKVDLQKPIAAILPENSHLEAHLFVPTRAIAFIKEGQKVLLQYEAFPHQKYGVQIGHILSVSHTVLNPNEISELDMGAFAEPFYRITVSLEKEAISAFAQNMPLQSGMMLKADIILERRSLVEWILEPLYRVRG